MISPSQDFLGVVCFIMSTLEFFFAVIKNFRQTYLLCVEFFFRINNSSFPQLRQEGLMYLLQKSSFYFYFFLMFFVSFSCWTGLFTCWLTTDTKSVLLGLGTLYVLISYHSQNPFKVRLSRGISCFRFLLVCSLSIFFFFFFFSFPHSSVCNV